MAGSQPCVEGVVWQQEQEEAVLSFVGRGPGSTPVDDCVEVSVGRRLNGGLLGPGIAASI